MKKNKKFISNKKREISFLLLFASLVTAILAMYTLKLFSEETSSTLGISTKEIIPSPTPSQATSPDPANSILGSDGTWCRDYDNSNTNSKSYCVDNTGIHTDYCSLTTAKQYYCTGIRNGSSWLKVTCTLNSYKCSSFGKVCSNGVCK